MKVNRLIIFGLTYLLLTNIGLATDTAPNTLEGTLGTLSKKERSIIKKRYPAYKENHELFSQEEFETIASEGLAPGVRQIIAHHRIILKRTDLVIAFARDVKNSGMTLEQLMPRLKRYLSNGDLIFTALDKSISRTWFHIWKEEKIQNIRSSDDPFKTTVEKLALADGQRLKLLSIYATCISSFANPYERSNYMTPKICDPIDDYKAPRHENYGVTVRTARSLVHSDEAIAYDALISAAKTVASEQSLDINEKILMAKCMAEQSLKFFKPEHHPIKALRKTMAMDHKSPEEAVFMRTGVCGNFSGITYNMALELGLDGQVFLARNGFHTYVEFTDGKEWFHTHPFNSKSPCDVNKF